MNEFLDIYRLYAKNIEHDFVDGGWSKEDVERLKELLDVLGGKIENGHIIIDILKVELEIREDTDMFIALSIVRDAVFKIESTIYSKDQEKKPDQLIEEEKPKSLLEFVQEKQKEKIAIEIKESGKGRCILGDEKLLKRYGAIIIYPTIKDYIWDRLPTDFRHTDVMAFFKEFYEKKLGRRIMDSSCSTYASGYIRFYKDQVPSIMSWDEYDYSKDIDKYKVVDKEPEKIDRPPKPHSSWKPRELQIIEKHSPNHTAKYIHKKLLPHRTASAIASKSKRLGIKKIRKYEKKHKAKIEIKLWRTEEDDVIRTRHPFMPVEDYIHELPSRTIYAVNKRAGYLKVKKDKDIKKEEAEDVIEDELTKKESVDKRVLTEETKKLLRDEHEKAEESIKPEPIKEHIDEKPEETHKEKTEVFKEIIEDKTLGQKTEITVEIHDKKPEEPIEPVKTKPDNPFYDGSAEHHLYRIAVETGWPGFKKGTPLIMIMRRMAEFPKDEIKNAIDTLVKKRKAQRLPNNFVAFYE